MRLETIPLTNELIDGTIQISNEYYLKGLKKGDIIYETKQGVNFAIKGEIISEVKLVDNYYVFDVKSNNKKFQFMINKDKIMIILLKKK